VYCSIADTRRLIDEHGRISWRKKRTLNGNERADFICV
jgi:hypothetical protein